MERNNSGVSSSRADEESEDDEEEQVRKVEEAVNQRAEKIVEYRSTLAAQLKTSLASILDTQSQPNHPTTDNEGPSQCVAALAGEVQKEGEKVELLKQKISSNASAIPTVLNRMKECMARIDKLQSSNIVIHPAFKRKRTS